MGFDLIVVGTSLGGLRALEALIGRIPEEFPLPIAVVQHRSADSGDRLRILLQRLSRLRVIEPNDKEPIQRGCIYLAPPDYHLLIERGSFALSTDEPVTYARPSIDVTFESAADAYGSGVVAVVLTGANHDGAAGAQAIKNAGGFVIVQDPTSSESPVMPRAALARVEADAVLPLEDIGPFLAGIASYE